MRGCLGVLVLAALFIAVGAWFGGPPIASAIVSTALTGSGLQSSDLDVRVEADPPVLVAVGRADRVEIDASDVEWNGLEARSLDLVLEDVDLVGRTAGHVEGRMIGAELPDIDPAGSLARIEFAGPADGAETTITIDAPTAEAVVAAAFENALGIQPDDVTFSEPDVLSIQTGGVRVSGALSVAPDGSVGIATPLGTVTIIGADPGQPVHLEGVDVEDGGLVLTGTLDVEGLLEG